MDMLSVLYDNGNINQGSELPSYNDFVNKLEKDKYSQKEINLFLTLCNYLEIFKYLQFFTFFSIIFLQNIQVLFFCSHISKQMLCVAFEHILHV